MARGDGLSRTPSVLCGERMERQEAVFFDGVRMVGSCLILIPALPSITKRKKAADLFKGGGLLVGSVWGRQVNAIGLQRPKPRCRSTRLGAGAAA